jgi:hypothetical protein
MQFLSLCVVLVELSFTTCITKNSAVKQLGKRITFGINTFTLYEKGQ